MRLICPNCGAQYEVPDHVVPTSGRDVQCSNCGHTWFETPGASVVAEEGDTPAGLPSNADEASRRSAQSVPAPELAPAPVIEPASDHLGSPVAEVSSRPPQDAAAPAVVWPADPGLASGDAPPTDGLIPDPADAIAALMRGDDPVKPVVTAQRRPLDPSVSEILREEAAHEEARRSSAGGLESQPDLGLDTRLDPEHQRAEEARRRLARLKGENPNLQPATRRERLPDIEEINSTLRSTSEREDAGYIDDAEDAPRRKSGARFGFRLVVLVALLGLAVYAF